MDVAPIVRGDFHYRDVLLVDCGGDLKRHARASEAEIKRLLDGNEASVKDPPGHWWEAQLIHYGLPGSKQKNTCKVRMFQALNQGHLQTQPPALAAMESQMKKEYAAAIRKAKGSKSSSTASPVTRKKRAREEQAERSAKKTKATVKTGNLSINIEECNSKGAKLVKAKRERTGSTKKPEHSSTKVDRQSPITYSSQASEWSGDPRENPDNVFQASSSKRVSNASKATPRPKKAKTEAAEKEPSMKDQSICYDDDNEMDMRPDITQDQLNITGVYNITCEQLALQAPDHADKFRLFICVDNDAGMIWGAFELAWKSGHIKMDDIAYDTPLTLDWRARDFEYKGCLRFGKGCFGEIEFYGCNRVQGTLHNLFPESIHFHGARRPGPLWCGRSAYRLKQEWNEYPREAYGS